MPSRHGLVVSVSASHAVFVPGSSHTKDHHKNGTNCLSAWHTYARGSEFDSAAQLYKRLGSVWNCLWGHVLKRSPGIKRKSRVLYPAPDFLTSAILPKKALN